MGGLIAYRRYRCQPRSQSGKVLMAVLPGLLLVALAAMAGCSTLRFYQQAVTGQVRLMAAREDVDQVLARQNLDPALRAALLDSQDALDFARTRLLLKSERRYGSYVDLKREFVVWNLVVTPVDSVQPLTWCFPVAGCVSYRGYFAEQLALDTAADFSPSEFDTYVGGVPAYSTLGWFNDPLLSSFIHWPRPARSELLFHELAHGKLYVAGDTEFNESFATYVAGYGLPLWLEDDGAIQTHRRARAERARFNGLLLKLRARLEADFAQPDLAQPSGEQLSPMSATQRRDRALALRTKRYAQAQACLVAVSDEFDDERWLEFFDKPPNMARLSLVGAYQRWVGAFRALHLETKSGEHSSIDAHDLGAFYVAAQALGELTMDARLAELERLSAKDLEQQVESKGDDQYADDIECEALADHPADGHLSG